MVMLLQMRTVSTAMRSLHKRLIHVSDLKMKMANNTALTLFEFARNKKFSTE